jgi:hypothetical protein
MMKRNDLAWHLYTNIVPEIPQNVNCRNCHMADVCAVYGKLYTNEESQLTISDKEIEFVQTWDKYLEIEESMSANQLKELWCLTAIERHELGRYSFVLVFIL